MNIVIHDLTQREWEKISDQYQNARVISDNGTIKKCVGCFGCWVKTPGQCVIPDEYQKMGEWIAKADKLFLISKCSFGGYSSFIKNVIDRSISYVLPYFEIKNGEMHHKARYRKNLEINVIFYGEDITEAEKKTAKELAAANAVNLHGTVGSVTFTTKEELCRIEAPQNEPYSGAVHEAPETAAMTEKTADEPHRQTAYEAPETAAMTEETPDEAHKVILLNCSYRGERSNSNYFLKRLEENLTLPCEHFHLSKKEDRTACLEKLEKGEAETLVLGMPLYVDSAPAQVVELMEQIYKKGISARRKFRVYVISNLGFYDSRQGHIELAIVKNWCDKINVTYGGGIAVGGGEMLGSLGAVPINQGPNKGLGEGLERMAAAVNQSQEFENVFVEPSGFPRWMYMLAAGSGWAPQAKKNGVKRREIRRKM